MSGKPATPTVARAGVPNAPRLLVYVADPRQLDPGAVAPDVSSEVSASLIEEPISTLESFFSHEISPQHVSMPRSSLPRTQIEQSNENNLSESFLYKALSDNHTKVSTFEPFDNSLSQHLEYYPVSQQVLKDSTIKIRDINLNEQLKAVSVKKDCDNHLIVELGSTLPSESGNQTAYQSRCQPPRLHDDSMPLIQSMLLNHGNVSDNNMVLCGSEGKDNSDRDLSVDKGFMNYQLLEQSVSHQSIVNQSISILNRQVGVGRNISSDNERNNMPQLVHTVDGMVLAVLPPPIVTNSPDTNLRIVDTEDPQTIAVPLGWKRVNNGSSVLYISPSGTALSTLPCLREYLQTSGTCKCGLPCPLRPEVVFNFDPKVVSKPYQPTSGAELAKLCNHKRKLLATLQASTQLTGAPSPHQMEQKIGSATFEAMGQKKKVKKRTGSSTTAMKPQLTLQREQHTVNLNDVKLQDTQLNNTTMPGVVSQRINSVANYPPVFTTISQSIDSDVKLDASIQKSSHYITVSSGWITQQESINTVQRQIQPLNSVTSLSPSAACTIGQICINTGVNKQTANPKCHHRFETQNPEYVDAEKILSLDQVKPPVKDEELQIYCGLNQPLTPEVMQKINEQQQLFIQQNQKQIELAMKGLRAQVSDSTTTNKSHITNQSGSQTQLLIQSGPVVKTNSAKTPPWQVKKIDSNTINSMISPNSKTHTTENLEFEDINMSSEESLSSNCSIYNDHMANLTICSRVPPLPQHYNMLDLQWLPEMNKKKGKSTGNKVVKKKQGPADSKLLTFTSNGMRLIHDVKAKQQETIPTSNVLSFIDDPNGYLAQQTVLLNDTISRQVATTSVYEVTSYDQNQVVKPYKPIGNVSEVTNLLKGTVMVESSISPKHNPDNSLRVDKCLDKTIQPFCKDCNITLKGNTGDIIDREMLIKYNKHNIYKFDMNSAAISPKNILEETLTTPSLYLERNQIIADSYSPVQAGLISTSIEIQPPPLPSPTLSASSRSTDTPLGSGCTNSQLQPNSSFPSASPANIGGCCNYSSNPSTLSNIQSFYNSLGHPKTNSITGTQMMHFISNHNVNKNIMEVDNISMLCARPSSRAQEFKIEPKKRIDYANNMPGYCPPPHLGSGPAHSLIQTCYIQTFITTMASGFSVTRDTVTSVLAGKANTSTTSINASQANFIRPPPPPSVNLATTYAIPNNQPDPFFNSVNLPTSYPLHIAGSTAQKMISKSPLEMVQNVIGAPHPKIEISGSQSTSLSQIARKLSTASTPGQIIISSTGPAMVSSNQMLPPPPKLTTTSNQSFTTSTTQVVSAMGGVQSIVNQPAVVVNTLAPPFVIQPPIMAVDGQVVQQSTVLPQLVSGGIAQGHSSNENTQQIDIKSSQNFVQGVSMLSPESLKSRNNNNKKKIQPAGITNVLHISAPQQNHNGLMVQNTSPQQNSGSQFSPRGFQLSPNSNLSPAPMLQALTIVPGKSGTPAHIVMNGQGNSGNFGSQQIIANNSPTQQINLLQPVNLINNSSGVVPNFQTFQQFIVPNLGGMVMTADGTTIIQDNTPGLPLQLQLQSVNNQNVLTPVQNSGVFSASTNGSVMIRPQNQQGKVVHSPNSPTTQFLSTNNQVMMNSPNFSSQLSPLLASLSPTNITFNTSPHQVKSGNVQSQELIPPHQVGQTLMLPVSPKQVSLASGSVNRNTSTLVQQNTLDQQQTTLVSNSLNTQLPSLTSNIQSSYRMSSNSNTLTANTPLTQKGKSLHDIPEEKKNTEDVKTEKMGISLYSGQYEKEVNMDSYEEYARFLSEFNPLIQNLDAHFRHSVSTQTFLNQQRGKSPCSQGVSGSSPPDTTTHSPLGALEQGRACSPAVYSSRCVSTQGNYADTTTKSPEPLDANFSAMVQCVSSSEQDIAESFEHIWPTPNDFPSDIDTHSLLMNPNRCFSMMNAVESTDMHYTCNMSTSSVTEQQNAITLNQHYYERGQSLKRKNDFGDGYRTDKNVRSNYPTAHGIPKEMEYDYSRENIPGKCQGRHLPSAGTSADAAAIQKVFSIHNLSSSNDPKQENETYRAQDESSREKTARPFEVGDLVWGPVKGYASWPGKLEKRCEGDRWSVRWFGGDKSVGTVEDSRLLTLTEGLEAHHAARTKHRKSRKLNTLLENAIQEAMAELDKKCEANSTKQASEVTNEDIETVSNSDAPKRTKKSDKVKNTKQIKSNVPKVPNQNKCLEGTRLRSSR